MANHYFKFKQFTVWQDRCAMKVGTDGVLLGAWCEVGGRKRILDVGTGTGLISLMLAQRSQALITAIDVDEKAVSQARENVNRSPWDRIEVIQADFKQFCPENRYDMIVSNPPYFVRSLKSPDGQRTLARHADELNYTDLFAGVDRLLTPNGLFSLIIPAESLPEIISLSQQFNLSLLRRLNVITKPAAAPKRILITFSREEPTDIPAATNLLIEHARHQYSEAYIQLTQDFYLAM
jgi:tRNA1Val (adenine37-N6)-methyltransferase